MGSAPESDAITTLRQTAVLDNQLAYLRILWNCTGNYATLAGGGLKRCTTRRRTPLICFMLQPRKLYIHKFEALLEAFLCPVSGHPVNISENWLIDAQRRFCPREDDARGFETSNTAEKGFGLRRFVPASMTNTSTCWHKATQKYFALCSQIGPSTFLLILIMNPDWAVIRA
jgi:hypothetical protein